MVVVTTLGWLIAAVSGAGLAAVIADIVRRAKRSGIWEHLFEVGSESDGLLRVRQPFFGPDPVQLFLGESGTRAHPTPSTPLTLGAIAPQKVVESRPLLVQQPGSVDLVVASRSFDGLTAAVLLSRHLGEPEVVYADAYNLLRRLREHAPGIGSQTVNRLIVLDVAVPVATGEQRLQELQDLLEMYRRERAKIFWYDRHMWNDEAFNLVRGAAAELVVDEERSTTSLLAEAQYEKDPFAERCVGMVDREAPNRDAVWAESWSGFVAAATEPRVAPELRTSIVRRVAREEQPRANEIALLEQMGRGERIATRFARLVRPWLIEGRTRKLAVIDARRFHLEFDEAGRKLYTLMLRDLSQREAFRVASAVDADLLVMIESNRRFMIQRCGESKVRLTELFALDELAGTPVTVYGHNEACTVAVRRDARLRKRRFWDLSDEAKALIRHVDEQYV